MNTEERILAHIGAIVLTDEQLRTILGALRARVDSLSWSESRDQREECQRAFSAIATIQAEIDRRQVALVDAEICKLCNGSGVSLASSNLLCANCEGTGSPR